MQDFIELDSLKVSLGEIPARVLMMKVRDVANIAYVAVRGKDNEQAAVQRVLSPSRLLSIKEYVLKGNSFYSAFYLNWNKVENPIVGFLDQGQKISIPQISSSAQILDGQHRLEGLKLAMAESPQVGDSLILVVLTNNLSTEQAASIFLNINTEQRPVSKSLIYDLYGVVSQNKGDYAILRARDIAMNLHEDTRSPYLRQVKLPGTPKGSGYVDLSTIVNSLTPLLKESGAFPSQHIDSLNYQTSLLISYFDAIKTAYESEGIWSNKTKNPFLTNAGFNAAITILKDVLIAKCVEKKSFTKETFVDLLNLEPPLLTRLDIKNCDGKTQRKEIEKFLRNSINSNMPQEDAYQFD